MRNGGWVQRGEWELILMSKDPDVLVSVSILSFGWGGGVFFPIKGGIQGKEGQALSHEGCLHPTVGRWSVPTPFMLGLKEESLINKLNQ